MRVIVAPDSFKGSASAAAAADAMARGVRCAAPQAAVELYPMADGGEGTLAALARTDTEARHGGVRLHTVRTHDALGRGCKATFGLVGSPATAIVELAQAAGLPQLADAAPRPGAAGTDGVGRVIRAALDAGAAAILLCLGGSATTDGGTGILRALGARFLDDAGHDLPPGGASLSALARIDISGLDARARAVGWQLACDVSNPLTGPDGAAAVFGPQKGATPSDVAQLDAGLTRLAAVLRDGVGNIDTHMPGMGAAGGTPACLVAAFHARLAPGARLVADAIGLTGALDGAGVLITGEGALDASSLQGKVVGTLARLASARGVGVGVVAGSSSLSCAQVTQAGIGAVGALADTGHDLAYLMEHCTELLPGLTRQVVTSLLRPPPYRGKSVR